MKTFRKSLFALLCLSAVALNAQVISYWNFNSVPPDNNTATGTLSPAFGSGTVTTIGGTTSTYASGTASGGSSDTTAADNSGLNLSSFPAQGSNNETAGIQVAASTQGFNHIIIYFDLRTSNTASRWWRLQYTTDGTNFINYSGVGTDSAGLYKASLGGDRWYNRRMADLRGIANVGNNPNFAFRVVSAFNPGTATYVAANPSSNYASSGTWRFDGITVANLFSFQILHASDHEGGLEATKDAPGFAAVIDKLEDEVANSLTLFSGDLFIPSPFLSASEDPNLQTPLRSTASGYWAGNAGQLRPSIGRADIAIMNIIGVRASVLGNHEFDLGTTELNNMIGVDIRSNGADRRWIGAQFPYLSANLDFSNDPSLSYLFTDQVLPDTQFKTPTTITNNNQKRGLAPYTMIWTGGEWIGVVGVTTPILAQISSPGATTVKGPGAGTNDMNLLAQVVQPAIDSLLNRGINKIVVLSHLQQLQFEEALLPLLRGVDIMIAGGNHELLADGQDDLRPGDVRSREYPIITQNADNQPAIILNTAANYTYVGRYIANFDANGVLQVDLHDSLVNGSYRTDSTGVANVWGNYADAFAPGTRGALVKVLCDSLDAVIMRKDGNLFGKSNVFLEGRRQLVRTEETNLGNISADANLAIALIADPQVKVSLKNGGGIRSAIGEVFAAGSNVELRPTAPNAAAGKQRGDISQLDIENAMRFNNRLSIVTLTATGLKQILEHGVSATNPGATPGQFPQVSGVRFSYDISKAAGSRIWSAVLVDTLGTTTDTLVFRGNVYGDPNRQIKMVTLNFLAGGGDSYPFPTLGSNRIDLDTSSVLAATPSYANFTVTGSEQDAFAEYMITRFGTNPYSDTDRVITQDIRIQQLPTATDRIFPPMSAFNLLTPANNASVSVEQGSNTPIVISWSASNSALNYKWKAQIPGGNFTSPILDLASDASGRATTLTLTSGAVDAILAGAGIPSGGSLTLEWTVYAFDSVDSLRAQEVRTVTLTRGVVLGAFNLLSPANNATVAVEAGSNAQINITWGTSAGATRYNWKARIPGGSFSTPILNFPSNNSGQATQLTLTSGAVDAILATAGIPQGGSLALEWTVFAYASTDSLQASNVFTVVLSRRVPLAGSFNLNSPTNNTLVTTIEGSTTQVTIDWSDANGAATYTWQLDEPGGFFASPIIELNADNNGRDSRLSTTLGALDQVLAGAGLQKGGDTLTAVWRVVARNSVNAITPSAQTFTIRLTRGVPTNINQVLVQELMVYPNPTTNSVFVTRPAGQEAATLQIFDLSGKMILTVQLSADVNEVSLQNFDAGLYLFQVQQGPTISRTKVVKH